MTHHKLGECAMRYLKENVLSLLYKKEKKRFPQYLLSITVCHDPPLLVFSSGLFTLFALSPQLSLSLSLTSPRYTPPLLFIMALALWDPLVRPGITPPFQRSRNAAWSLPSVYSISPFICWDKKCKAAPTWISLSPPVGTCAGHFRSRFRAESTRGKERLT